MNAIETYFDRRAKNVVSNVGKVFGFSIGYTMAEGQDKPFGTKVLTGLTVGIALGLAGRLIDNTIRNS